MVVSVLIYCQFSEFYEFYPHAKRNGLDWRNLLKGPCSTELQRRKAIYES